MVTVCTFEYEAVTATMIGGSLAKESCEEDSLANICVTMSVEVHFISNFIGCVSERYYCWYVRNGHKGWRFGNVEKIDVPVETHVNEPVVRRLTVDVPRRDFGEGVGH